jgi:hypothetical protein
MWNFIRSAVLTLLLVCISGFAHADDPAVQPAAEVTANDSTTTAPTNKAEIKEGTILTVELLDGLSSKLSKTGEIFRMKSKHDVTVDGNVVIPAGSMAYGTITYAEPRRMLGQPGELYYRVDYLKVGEQQIKIRASRGGEGKDATGSTVALVALFGVFGMFKKGKDIEVPAGTAFEVYIAENATVSL